MFCISIQRQKDANTIEALLDVVFGKNRYTKASYRFRDRVNDLPTLRFIAHKEDLVVGTIRFWPVLIQGDHSSRALLLGPLGIAPDHQGQGIGAALINHGLNMAREQGHHIVLLVGELSYYGRFGFSPASARYINMPDEQPSRLLLRELKNDALDNVQGCVSSMAPSITNI